jgi:hypothetical protein
VSDNRNDDAERTGDPEQGSAWLNIAKILFLIGVLTAAWFLLDRLIGGK